MTSRCVCGVVERHGARGRHHGARNSQVLPELHLHAGNTAARRKAKPGPAHPVPEEHGGRTHTHTQTDRHPVLCRVRHSPLPPLLGVQGVQDDRSLQGVQEEQENRSLKRARLELEEAACVSARQLEVHTHHTHHTHIHMHAHTGLNEDTHSILYVPCSVLQQEVERNRELLGRIRRLEERVDEAARSQSEQEGARRSLRSNLEAVNRRLADRDAQLSSAQQVGGGAGAVKCLSEKMY